MNRYILSNVIKKINKFRKPECIAKTVKNGNDFLEVEFSRTSTPFSCCLDEYFNDLSILLENVSGVKFKISDIARKNINNFLVTYKINNN